MARRKKVVDILDILDNSSDGSNAGGISGALKSSESVGKEGAFYDRILNSIDTHGGYGAAESFTIREMESPAECFAAMMPTAESVMVHLAGLYSMQFPKTWEVLKKHSERVLLQIDNSDLDDLIAEYFKKILENPL